VSPIRILLVDDDANFRELLALLLRADLGAEIVGHAADGSIGVQLAEELRPDVVVMDLRMPTMDGFEATRRIVASVPETRVVVVSSSTEPDDVERAGEAGAAAYLCKDRAVTELAGEIARLTAERRRARRSPLSLFLDRRLVLG
jgi:DNA-binding NarL/FixJ family response regulator